MKQQSEVIKSGVESKKAYVTFLAGNGDYVKGVVALAKGLRKHNAAYPLVVAVLPDVPREHRQMLLHQGCILKDIHLVHPPPTTTQFVRAYFGINYSKLPIWKFVEYERMVYLDADIQVFDNIDHLFDLPKGYFYAVVSCFCEPGWITTPQYKIGYCQQHPDKVEWPTAELGPPPCNYFNAGFFVFEPSIPTYDDLIKTLMKTPPTLFAEQDFLNMYFKDRFKPLPIDYNMMLHFLWRHPEKVDLNKAKMVHYCVAGSKPWSHTGRETNLDRDDVKTLVKRWWDIYDDSSLDYNTVSTRLLSTQTTITTVVAPTVARNS
ncbi:hypothetical protein RND81_10G245500 [Saponaria officinalis]|uniref:Hexosyltransferase n=1 Tax=Saponaria officinalis TaxID=3572 RepID=A0AAW1I7Z3_SAPOF